MCYISDDNDEYDNSQVGGKVGFRDPFTFDGAYQNSRNKDKYGWVYTEDFG